MYEWLIYNCVYNIRPFRSQLKLLLFIISLHVYKKKPPKNKTNKPPKPNFKRDITVTLQRKSSKCLNLETNGSTGLFRQFIICKNLASCCNGTLQKSGSFCFQGHSEERQAMCRTLLGITLVGFLVWWFFFLPSPLIKNKAKHLNSCRGKNSEVMKT